MTQFSTVTAAQVLLLLCCSNAHLSTVSAAQVLLLLCCSSAHLSTGSAAAPVLVTHLSTDSSAAPPALVTHLSPPALVLVSTAAALAQMSVNVLLLLLKCFKSIACDTFFARRAWRLHSIAF